jgi:pyridoxine 5-phosphate synthase
VRRLVGLGVNIDHVATLRQARYPSLKALGVEPDPVEAAVEAMAGGADGITLHLREDRRHVQDRDFRMVRKRVTGKLNLEMASDERLWRLVRTVRPDQVTLVPERREELTTEGGLDVGKWLRGESASCRRLRERVIGGGRIGLSLFVDPREGSVRRARAAGAAAVELHTGVYANAAGARARRRALEDLRWTASLARELGLTVYAGHGLNYDNVVAVVVIPEIEELNIGHSIVSRSLFVGMREAVRQMKGLMKKGR